MTLVRAFRVRRHSSRDGHQPIADAARMIQAVDVLQQAQPRRLRDVGGLSLGQLEVPGHGPDELGVLLDQPFPRLLVPLRRASHHQRGIEWGGLGYRRNRTIIVGPHHPAQ